MAYQSPAGSGWCCCTTISATGTSFGPLPDLLAQTRQVIAVEQQAHGRIADIDRPMPVQAIAGNTRALLASPGIGRAGLFGYSLAAGIALNLITNHPASLNRLIMLALMSATRRDAGVFAFMSGHLP